MAQRKVGQRRPWHLNGQASADSFADNPMALVASALTENDKGAFVHACNQVRNLDTPPLLPEHRTRAWPILLGIGSGTPDSGYSDWKVDLTEPNQRVIAHDCERTRAGSEKLRTTEARNLMEKMLTFFVRKHKIKYKQGLNEILAPFIFLITENSDVFTEEDAFQCFDAFIKLFLPNIFTDENFYCLQSIFLLYRSLFRYHFPKLENFLREKDGSPELYATPWFLTLWAAKTDLDIVMELWDLLLIRGQRHFPVFFAVALITYNQESVLCCDNTSLPEVLTQIKLTSMKQLRQVWAEAERLADITPTSFSTRLDMTIDRVGTEEQLIELEQSNEFELYTSEVVRVANALRFGQQLPGKMKMRFVDVRPSWQFDGGHLPKSTNFDLDQIAEEWKDGESADITNIGYQFQHNLGSTSLQSDHHICLVGVNENCARVRWLFKVLVFELNVRWISICSGGYETIHNNAFTSGNLNVEGGFLEDHIAAQCLVCTPDLENEYGNSGGYFANLARRVQKNVKSSIQAASAWRSTSEEKQARVQETLDWAFVRHNILKYANSQWAHFASRAITVVTSDGESVLSGSIGAGDQAYPVMLVVDPQNIRCTARPLDIESDQPEEVHVLAKFSIRDVYKITSKRTVTSCICFYFNQDQQRPFLILKFDRQEDAQACIAMVRGIYRGLRDGGYNKMAR